MKLRMDRNVLVTAIMRSQGAISDRALAQMGLQANDQSKLLVSATDRILAVFSHLDADIEQTGTVFVPGKLFSEVVRQLPDGEVELSSDQSFLTIKAASGFLMKLPLMEDLSWKDAPDFGLSNSALVSAEKLLYMIQQVQFCIEQESPRNYGAVGYLHKPEEGRLRLVGTDGFRLSYCEVKMDLPAEFMKGGVCLSKRGLIELQRMCQEGYENLRLAIAPDETTLLAEVDNYQIYMRLSAVKYPNYRGVLPTANLNPIRLSRSGIQSIARRVLLAADKTNALRLSFNEGNLTLSSHTAGSSESKESFPVVGYKGSKTDLSVNGKFLTDVFSTVESDELTFQFRNEDDPIVIIPREEPIDCRSMHVLVPIRENN